VVDPAVVTDDPAAPTQYRYIGTHAWWLASFGAGTKQYAYLGENIVRQWVPVDPQREWLLDRQVTGHRVWLSGSPEQALAEGVGVTDGWPAGRWRAAYGDYYTSPGRKPTPRNGSWQQPTTEFLAGLPREPRALYSRLEADSPQDRPGYVGAVVYARDALRTGLVPASMRAALYQALLLVPGMVLEDNAQNADGQPGIALVMDDGVYRIEIVIDPGTGQFIGERETLASDNLDLSLAAGTVMQSTAVTTAIVGEIETLPA